MRIGFLSDAHGNPFGLKLGIDMLRLADVDRVYFLGDALGYFPNVSEVLTMLMTNEVRCLKGNHEAMLLDQIPLSSDSEPICRIEDARRRMNGKEMDQVASWKVTDNVEVDGKRIALMHGRPNDPLNGYLYLDSNLKELNAIEADLIFVGHTHRPYNSRLENLRVVNVGSTSLPRQGGGSATCAIYDSESDCARLLYAPLPIRRMLQYYRGMVDERVIATLRR